MSLRLLLLRARTFFASLSGFFAWRFSAAMLSSLRERLPFAFWFQRSLDFFGTVLRVNLIGDRITCHGHNCASGFSRQC